MTTTDTAAPVVLALDTSTPMLTAALRVGHDVHSRQVAAGRHTGALVPAVVDEVVAAAGCTPSDVGVIAVGVGPGPYTSLRAGVMFAEAAAAAMAIPVVGACSLDVTARAQASASPHSGFVVAADARRRELYWAHYDPMGRRLSGPQVQSREHLQRWFAEQGLHVVTAPPDAAVLAQWVAAEYLRHDGQPPALAATPRQWAGPGDDAAGVEVPQALLPARPLYLRRPDATEPAGVGAASPEVDR